MTSNEEMIVYIQAEIDGKEVQIRGANTDIWVAKGAYWHSNNTYRVKPEPPYCYGSISTSGHIGPVVHSTIEEAGRAQKDCWGDDDSIIKFIAAPDEEQPFL